MVGRLLSFWDGPFSGAMLVYRSVIGTEILSVDDCSYFLRGIQLTCIPLSQLGGECKNVAD